MVSIIKVSVLLLSPITPFRRLFFLSVLSRSPSPRTPISPWLAIHAAIFWRGNLFSALTMCANQSEPLLQHTAWVLINKIWEFHQSRWTLWCTLDQAPLLFILSAIPPASLLRKVCCLNPLTVPLFGQIPNPLITCRSGTFQAQRTKIHPR